MNRLVLFLYIAAVALFPLDTQNRPADKSREIKAGEVVALDENLSVRVTQTTPAAFEGVKLKGAGVVVVIELDAGKNSVTFLYRLHPIAKSSEIFLVSGGEKLAPRALIEDFPSFGTDNEKEVEVVDPKGGLSPSTLDFEGKGSISFLFDVPASQAKTPKKFSAIIRTTKPKSEEHSLTVGM
jgi:hypothetical protein